VPRVTALTPDRTGSHVLVELDGAPWRRIPVEIAVRVGLGTHAELGRAELRRLRRELRRGEALDAAVRALRHRDRSRATLRERLVGAGIAPWACEQALDALARAGIVDDARFARARAKALADRGSGDALIQADLLAAGVSEPDAAQTIGELEPESERATRLVAARGATTATARWLARRGFGEEAIEAAFPTFIADQS
jgi:SOS response regulatory protein OraA/RecX